MEMFWIIVCWYLSGLLPCIWLIDAMARNFGRQFGPWASDVELADCVFAAFMALFGPLGGVMAAGFAIHLECAFRGGKAKRKSGPLVLWSYRDD